MRLGPDPCVHAGCGPVLWDYPVLFLVVVVVGGGGLFREFGLCSLLHERRREGGREGQGVTAATVSLSLLRITASWVWTCLAQMIHLHSVKT